MNINELLELTVKKSASDLHLPSGDSPMLRIDGELNRLDKPVLDPKILEKTLFEILTEEQKKIFEENKEVDFSYEIPKLARFRVNVFMQSRGISAAFRLIPIEIPTMEKLHLPETFKKMCNFDNGIVIVTGPTGSGKSTTLAAMIDYINQTSGEHEHIITIEDPIEFIYENANCLIQQREVGKETKSFNNALRAALRQDPDIILVGEMRDLETIQLALTAAETGHLVFATMHTNSASKSIDRIIDAFPGGEKEMIRTMLAEALRAVIAQTLLKRPQGGRIAAHEIMICTPAIRNLIREHKIAQIFSVIQTGQQLGMHTMEQNIKELAQKKLIMPPPKSDWE